MSHEAPGHNGQATGPAKLEMWDAQDDRPPLAVIEADFVRLLRELSAAKLASTELERSGFQSQKRLLVGVAEVLDGMQRLLKQVEEKKTQGMVFEPIVKAWLGNFRTCSKQLKRVLTENQVVEFDAGATFDPHEHNVLEVRVDPTQADGTVVETTLPGYRWRSEVLRRAQVIVVGAEADQAESRGDEAGDSAG